MLLGDVVDGPIRERDAHGVVVYGLILLAVGVAEALRRGIMSRATAHIETTIRLNLSAGCPAARPHRSGADGDGGGGRRHHSGVALALPPAIRLPAATTVGASGVPSGFPNTLEGAAAQLAAIEVRVLSAMSLPLATEVYRDWAIPGGVGAANWSQTRNVQSFLTHARQSSNQLDPGTLVSVTPVAIQIKGTDGPDWVVACVLLDVRAALRAEARMGYGTCERMQWTGDRLLIGPGAPPAPAPSTWPGSDASVEAGWQPVASN